MVQIVSQPYNRTYSYSYSSFTFMARVFLVVMTLMVPFFIVYKTGNFYQTSKTSYKSLQQINLKPTYQYYITLKTSGQSYIFTNFYVNQAYQGITIKFSQRETNSLKVEIQYPKQLAQKVKQVDMYIGFEYLNYDQSSFGLIKTNVRGYDLSEAGITGFIEFKDGTGENPVLKSRNVLRSNQFNFLSVYEEFYKSSSYLTYRYNSVPISLPSDLFHLSMVVNYPNIKVQENTPSILGQIIWSWVQYFPIFFVFYIFSDYVWQFLLRQGLVKRKIKHDKDYLEILSKQQERRHQLPYSSHN